RLSQTAGGHLGCFEDKLHVKVPFLASIKAGEPNEPLKGRARRQEPAKLAIGQWPQPQPECGLLVPDAAASDRVYTQNVVPLTQTETGAVCLREREPLSDKLGHCHWYAEIVLQQPCERTGRVGMLGEKPGVKQQRLVLHLQPAPQPFGAHTNQVKQVQ